MAATNTTTRTARVKFDGDARGLAAAARRAERAMSGVDKKSRLVGGALASVGASAVKLGPLLLAAFALAPAAAAAAASGIVLAFGGAIAGLGLIAAAQDREVRRAFGGLKDYVVGRMKAISTPLQGTLKHIADVARSTFDSFEPALRDAFKKLAPVLSGFATQFGRGFAELSKAVGPLTDAFSDLLRQLGPRMKPLFKDIAGALKNLSKTVSENKAEFALLVEAILKLIPLAINIIAKLAEGFATMVRVAGPLAAKYIHYQRGMLAAVSYFVENALAGFGQIIAGAAKAFGWVPGVGPKLQHVNAAFESWRGKLSSTFDKADARLADWEHSFRSMPKVLKLRGNINDLKSKIAEAKAKIKSVPKRKRAAIRAKISQLRGAVREAKRQLASVKSKSVTLTTYHRNIYTNNTVEPWGDPRFGRRAIGGPVQAGRSYLVGERGPEVVTFGRNGHVTPNHQLGSSATEVRVFIGERELTDIVRTEIHENDRGVRRRVSAGGVLA